LPLTDKQRGVIWGMSLGGLIALSLVGAGILLNPFGYVDPLSTGERLGVVLRAGLAPAFFVMLSIGLLARHRMLTPEDIDGGGLVEGTPRTRQLQAILQNTLEQAVLAWMVYLAWAFVMPTRWLSVVPLAAIAFVIGRGLFMRGYAKGAPARALGFTLSFYVSSTMLMSVLVYLVLGLVG
jgi:hypothetical protein